MAIHFTPPAVLEALQPAGRLFSFYRLRLFIISSVLICCAAIELNSDSLRPGCRYGSTRGSDLNRATLVLAFVRVTGTGQPASWILRVGIKLGYTFLAFIRVTGTGQPASRTAN